MLSAMLSVPYIVYMEAKLRAYIQLHSII